MSELAMTVGLSMAIGIVIGMLVRQPRRKAKTGDVNQAVLIQRLKAAAVLGERRGER